MATTLFGRLRALVAGEPPKTMPARAEPERTASATPLRVRASHAAPQSAEELAPFLAELHRLDPLLDFRWNAKAVLVQPGSYSEMGKLIDPIYDGRWEVIRYHTRTFSRRAEEREFVVICVVRDYERINGVLCLSDRHASGFQPIDQRIIEVMRAADAENMRSLTEIRRRLWAQHDLAEEEEFKLDESEAREGLDRAHFKANFAGGSGNWMGRGADFSSMAGKQ